MSEEQPVDITPLCILDNKAVVSMLKMKRLKLIGFMPEEPKNNSVTGFLPVFVSELYIIVLFLLKYEKCDDISFKHKYLIYPNILI
jgi:hypothetical protein